jgi:hypothetical protein
MQSTVLLPMLLIGVSFDLGGVSVLFVAALAKFCEWSVTKSYNLGLFVHCREIVLLGFFILERVCYAGG